MKLTCEIVQDLLPLYEENLCSEASRAAVEEHLKECSACRALVENIENLSEPKITVEVNMEEEAVVKSFRKVHRRWKESLLIMLLIIPLLLLTINQIIGRGICFTNVDEILAVRKYVKALEQGDFEKAAACKAFESMYREIQDLKIYWPDVNGSGYRTVVISDRDWVVTDTFFEDYLKWEDDSQNFWGNVIFNHVQQVMIPENVWKEITSMEPDLLQTTEEGELIFGSTIYVFLDTRWGRYIVEKDSPLIACTTAEDFCNALEFIPSEIFKEAKPELEEKAWEQYYHKKNTYAEARKMTLEEFTAYMQEKYASKLKACAEKGFAFERAGFKGSYYDEEWHISYGMKVTHKGNSVPADIACEVMDGKINIFSIGWPQEFPESDIVGEALFAYYVD